MKPPVAVIGIHSFSGASYANYLLNRGERVIGFARSKEIEEIFLPFKKSNREDSDNCAVMYTNLLYDAELIAETIRENKVENVLNFAAQSMVAESWDFPQDWYDVNISGFSKLVRTLSSCKSNHLSKFISFTTPEVYGNTNGMIRENWNFNPTTPYAISRAAADLHLRALNQAFGFPVIFTRTSNIYGKNQRLHRLIPKLIVQILKGQKFELHGGGKSVRAFIHSDDVAEALWKVMQIGKIGDTYHISSENFTSILDLVNLILEKLNASFDKHIITHEERTGKDQAYLLDSSKIRRELGWADKVTLETGIDQVINWVMENWTKIKEMNLNYIHSR